jgi:Tfp pilus assembly protein PilX
MRIVPRSIRRRAQDEGGYTLIFAIVVMLVSSMLITAALASTSGDIRLTRTYTSQQKAYFAAQAGIQVYEYHLSVEPNYWLSCPKTSSAVGVPGTSDETYKYETVPATSHATCKANEQVTIIEASSSANGTFRIKSVGESGGVKRSIVATLKHPGFLDYVFLSNYEVEDPSTIPGEPSECAHYLKEREKLGVTSKCPPVPFVPEDQLNGPFHTNDAASVCSGGGEGGAAPSFGRSSSDSIEMNGGHYAYPSSFDPFCGNSPTIKGTFTEKGATLTPPETDTELLEQAEYRFEGRTVIELKKNKLKVWTAKIPGGEEKAFPANGVIYVENEGSCPIKYSPFSGDTDYKEDAKCGDVYIKGEYTASLTVGSAEDVIVIGNIETEHESSGKPTGAATLGLIAQNFVRVFHPVKCSSFCKNEREVSAPGGTCNYSNQSAKEGPPEEWGWSGFGAKSGWGSQENLTIDAAILSTSHSFIVDNFLCGSSLGTLTIWGAIAQNFRGRVCCAKTIKPGTGYVKDYNYDERLKTIQPPSFLTPTATSGWTIERETEGLPD